MSQKSPMRVVSEAWCGLTGGHRWTDSRSQRDCFTCVRCRMRRSKAWMAKHPKAVFDR